MDYITSKALATQLLVTSYVSGAFDRVRRDDRGQASTEYAGILFVIVAIITAVVAAVSTGVGTAIQAKIVEAIGKVGI